MWDLGWGFLSRYHVLSSAEGFGFLSVVFMFAVHGCRSCPYGWYVQQVEPEAGEAPRISLYC